MSGVTSSSDSGRSSGVTSSSGSGRSSDVTTHVEVRRGTYFDSVTLLGVSQEVQGVEGVDRALVAMATPLNLEVLGDLGFDADGLEDVTPNDLLVAVRAAADALPGALQRMEDALASRPAPGPPAAGGSPRRTAGAAARDGDANLALISVPGGNAFVEAMDALRAGLHVMLFSDNVGVEQEIALKAEGARRGLLVMGPDCGTTIIGGVGLGFANVVRPGPVGIVAASGTGAQQVCCLLDDVGVGVSHVIGVGGRDLSADVGGSTTLRALDALDRDEATELIVVVSKPPDVAVADRVRERAATCSTPVVLGFIGPGRPDLTAVTLEAIERLGPPPAESRHWRPERPPARWRSPSPSDPRPPARWSSPSPSDPPARPSAGAATLRGLFSGGTLCQEAMVIAADALGPIASNVPLRPEWTVEDPVQHDGHLMLDLGDDRLTRGRPHPMIDHSLRLARLAREAERPGNHVVLLDVVLGHGADPDPATAIAPAIRMAQDRATDRGDRMAVVVSLCGTRDDPQDLQRQANRLADAGAVVHLSNARAARAAVELVSGGVS
jgi:FdrA protein